MRLLTLTLPPERASATALRAWLRNLLAEAHVLEQAGREIVLAAEEVLSNAILHSGQKDGDLTIMVSIVADDLYLTVSDRGQGFDAELPAGGKTVGALEAAGLGLTLVRALMDEVTVKSGSEGTSIRLVKHLPRSEKALP